MKQQKIIQNAFDYMEEVERLKHSLFKPSKTMKESYLYLIGAVIFYLAVVQFGLTTIQMLVIIGLAIASGFFGAGFMLSLFRDHFELNDMIDVDDLCKKPKKNKIYLEPVKGRFGQ